MMTAARMLVPGDLVTGTRSIDRLFEQFFGYGAASVEDGTPTYALPVDILETEDAYELHATVAGVPQDAVEVTFESGMLSIAVKAAPLEIQGKLIRQERPWGNWSRKLELPKEIDSAKIAAQFENGVLTVRVPKAAKVQPVRIAIAGAGKATALPKGRG
jgi:HSP20 family protein